MVSIRPVHHSLGIACLCTSALTTIGHAQCRYDVSVVYGPPCGPDGDATDIIPLDLNDDGAVVGYFQCWLSTTIAFQWHAETGLEILDLPDGSINSKATSIANDGTIAGYHGLDGAARSFMFIGDEYMDLGLAPESTFRRVYGMNDDRVTVGEEWFGNELYPRAFARLPDGEIEYPFPLEKHPELFHRLFAVNSTGLAVGAVSSFGPMPTRPLIWQIGKRPIELPLPDGFNRGQFSAVNEGRIAVGRLVSDDDRAYGLMLRDETLHSYEAPAPYDHLIFNSINDAGVFIGGASGQGLPGRSIIYFSDTWHFIADLVEVPGEIQLTSLAFINNHGTIVTEGVDPVSGWMLLILDPIRESPADLDIDCDVDVIDLSLLFEHWGRARGSSAIGDITGDGLVDVRDLLELLAEWTG